MRFGEAMRLPTLSWGGDDEPLARGPARFYAWRGRGGVGRRLLMEKKTGRVEIDHSPQTATLFLDVHMPRDVGSKCCQVAGPARARPIWCFVTGSIVRGWQPSWERALDAPV